MKRSLLYLIFISLLCGSVTAQTFQAPESAIYHSQSNCYYISNYANGDLIRINADGSKSLIDSSMSHALGIIIYDNTLYVISNPQGVKGFDLSNGKNTFDIIIKEAQFLNDITRVGNTLYVTDSRVSIIYTIDLAAQSYGKYLQVDTPDANGILYDEKNDRLVVCHFRKQAPLTLISLQDKTQTTVADTLIDNLDGLAIDANGNIYVSSWGAGSFQTGFNEGGTIYKYKPDFSSKPEIFCKGLQGPADIYFNIDKNEMVIPQFLANEVTFQTAEK